MYQTPQTCNPIRCFKKKKKVLSRGKKLRPQEVKELEQFFKKLESESKYIYTQISGLSRKPKHSPAGISSGLAWPAGHQRPQLLLAHSVASLSLWCPLRGPRGLLSHRWDSSWKKGIIGLFLSSGAELGLMAAEG